jgi:hypothetical protein
MEPIIALPIEVLVLCAICLEGDRAQSFQDDAKGVIFYVF